MMQERKQSIYSDTGKVLLEFEENPSPIDVFIKCTGLDGLFSLVRDESQRYAMQNGRVFETNDEELAAFLGVIFVMGINKLPSLKLYWATDEGLGNALIKNTMTRQRYMDILQNLHFADNTQTLPPKTCPTFDRAWKVRPFLDHLQRHFMSSLEPEAQQSVDEHMCKFKGRSILRQYMKNKPIKWGFKFWFRCGSKSGYLYQFDIYTGRKEQTEHGLGESVVLRLCEPLQNSFCQVFFDNFFNSPNLMVELLQKGIYATGTVRKNRCNMPKTFVDDKGMKRGDSDCVQSHDIVALKWMNTRSVILLSNIEDPTKITTVERRVKGKPDKARIPCPAIVKSHNASMGGVDLLDQMKVYYQLDRKSKFRFYLRIFFDLMDVSVVNSLYIYNKICKENSQMSLLDFKFCVARALIGKFSSRQRTAPSSRPSKRSRPESCPVLGHLPEFVDKRVRCFKCASEGKEQRTFVRCTTLHFVW